MTETVEQRTRRRRWLNLAELVAVAGVVIAALGLYLSWSERRDAAAEKAASASAEARLELTATPADDGRTLRLNDTRHELTAVSLRYSTQSASPFSARRASRRSRRRHSRRNCCG